MMLALPVCYEQIYCSYFPLSTLSVQSCGGIASHDKVCLSHAPTYQEKKRQPLTSGYFACPSDSQSEQAHLRVLPQHNVMATLFCSSSLVAFYGLVSFNVTS